MMAMAKSNPEAMGIEMFPIVIEGVVDWPWKGDRCTGREKRGDERAIWGLGKMSHYHVQGSNRILQGFQMIASWLWSLFQ